MSRILLGVVVVVAVFARATIGEEFELSSVDWAVIVLLVVGAITSAIEGVNTNGD